MLDIKFIREHADEVRDASRRKRIPVDVDALLDCDQRLRESKAAFEERKAQQNRQSKEIGRLQGAERAEALAGMKQLAEEVKQLQAAVREAEDRLSGYLLEVPNVLDPEVPRGEDDADNVEIRRWSEVPTFDFPFKDHVQLGEELDLYDVERATRIAGSRTYFLKNEAALLELAVLRFALDHMVAKGFVPMIVPHLVRTEAMVGTAYLPGGEDQAYQTVQDQSWLIGTSEVALTAYHMGEILPEDALPVRLVGSSSCYRREAGAAGKDTRGLYRIHQFQKVEQVVVCRNDEEESRRWHRAILQNAEEVMQALELPYRVVNVCDGDLGRGQVQKFDIEAWMPSRESFGETHSASRFHEFQSRRLNLRYRDAEGKVRFCHTLNNTVIASPRVLIPLLEIHQQRDGSIRIPAALQPYMNGRTRIARGG